MFRSCVLFHPIVVNPAARGLGHCWTSLSGTPILCSCAQFLHFHTVSCGHTLLLEPYHIVKWTQTSWHIMTHHDTFICESFMWRCLFQCFALTSTSFKLHVWTQPPRAWCGDPPSSVFPGTMGSSGIITLLNREQYGNDGNDGNCILPTSIFESLIRTSCSNFLIFSVMIPTWCSAQDFVVAWGMTLSCGNKNRLMIADVLVDCSILSSTW